MADLFDTWMRKVIGPALLSNHQNLLSLGCRTHLRINACTKKLSFVKYILNLTLDDFLFFELVTTIKILSFDDFGITIGDNPFRQAF